MMHGQNHFKYSPSLIYSHRGQTRNPECTELISFLPNLIQV